MTHSKLNLIITFLLIIITHWASKAQIIGGGGGHRAEDAISWTYNIERINNTDFNLIFKADLTPGWYLYGPHQDYPFGSGPLPMEISYDDKSKFSLVGEITSSPKPEKKFDDVFKVYISQFDGKPVFKQRIKVSNEKPFTISGSIDGLICYDMCIPFTNSFTINVDGAIVAASEVDTDNDFIIEAINDTILIVGVDSTDHEKDRDICEDDLEPLMQENDIGADSSLLAFFLVAIGLGVLGIFTPCVFPMIPMNIAFFLNYRGGRTKGKFLAVFYGLSIIFIYSVLGLLITVIFGAEAMNNIVSHWVTNVIFFLIFLFFAASFFGLFELVLPAKWVNKADSQADRGGLVGTFFMALTLVLVSFSCTAAFIGAILVEAADGKTLLKPFIGMLGFAVGFGVPFSLFALFPTLMQKMPKSGGWMNAVKVVFGFIILAFGMKFLIVPDQAYHLGILTRDIYIAIWIVLFTLMGFYLLGKIRFAHDSELKHIGFFRLLLVIATFSFVVYLIPGMFGADLKGVSGLLPPKSAQKFDLARPAPTGLIVTPDHASLCSTPSHSDFLSLPHYLEGYFDLDEAIACAIEQNKPLFVDFTGHGCAECKVMEAQVWSDPRVLEKFKNDFIMVALYTNDKKTLPEDKWITTPDGTVLKTIGRINRYLQESQFGTVAIPMYVVLDHDGNMLSGPWQTDRNVDEFIKFLDKGLEMFNKNRN